MLAAAACDEAEGVDVQPLPPLERPSMAARAGLAEVEGTWRAAGFEVEPEDSARVSAVDSLLRLPGTLVVETQRLDSLAGRWRDAGGAYAVLGELRRDGTVALVVGPGADSARFVAGHVRGDTLWIEKTSLPAAESWPRGTRAALVRVREGEEVRPFVRLLGGAPLPRDSVRPDSLARDSLAADSAGPVVPAPSEVGAGVGETRPPPARRTPPPVRRPAPEPPREEPEPPARPQPEPPPPPRERAPEPEPERPAPRDTVRIPRTPPRTPEAERERPAEPPPLPQRPAPRDTLRFPTR